MSMDIFGKNPTQDAGLYFSSNVWFWRPLWAYCCKVGEKVINPFVGTGGMFNDGIELNAEKSSKLARILLSELRKGNTEQHRKDFYAYIKSLPTEKCTHCEDLPILEKQDCPHCLGKGKTRPWEAYYHFDIDAVQDFAEFLRHCGGFEIR